MIHAYASFYRLWSAAKLKAIYIAQALNLHNMQVLFRVCQTLFSE